VEFFHKQTNFPFMDTRKVWYTLSAVLMIGSVVSFATRGLNLAIDFTGGVSVQATFAQAANADAIRNGLAQAGFRDPQVQNFGSARDVAIRLPADPNQSADATRTKLEAVLQSVDKTAQVQQLEAMVPLYVSAHATAAVVSGWTGIPVGKMLTDEIRGVLELKERSSCSNP